jgi:chloramphenicol-sensitive protein RarD
VLFYLNPALQMAWGVLIGHEPMPVGRWIGFALIWVALVIFSADAVRPRLCTSRPPRDAQISSDP